MAGGFSRRAAAVFSGTAALERAFPHARARVLANGAASTGEFGVMSMLTLPGFAEGDPVAELWDRHCRSRQPESKATCAVLEAVADILQQEGIAPSPTAVFAATMSSLERADAAMPAEQTGAMLTVLATALEHAPPAPVLSRLPATAKVLMSAGRAGQELSLIHI